MNPTHIHTPSNTKCCIKKKYDTIATVYVEPYPFSIMWGKKEYANTLIVKLADLTIIATNNAKP